MLRLLFLFLFSFLNGDDDSKIYGQEAIGCGPRVEILYKVALLMDRHRIVI